MINVKYLACIGLVAGLAAGLSPTSAPASPLGAPLASAASSMTAEPSLILVQRRRGGPGFRGPGVGRPGFRRGGRRGNAGAAIAGGVLGGIAAGIIASEAARAAQPRYVVPDDAIAYCMQRYRSYDPDSMTYMGFDGLRHPCP